MKRGDIVAEVETEKADIDVEIFATGIVHELLVQPGQKVPVGTVLATILEEGEAATPTPHERARISPLAKKLAGELGVDVTAVHGTGPGGAITREDIERAAPPKPGAEASVGPGRASSGNAARHRRRHGAIESGDPALLPRNTNRHASRARMASSRKPEANREGSVAACSLADSRRNASTERCSGSQRLLDQRSSRD